jgi:fatty acid amide hydrolase 2
VTATATSTPPLTRRSAVALAAAIRAGEVAAREVVEEHIEVLERAQPRTRALAMDRFDEARREAAEADARVPEGPLHGVPCTIKESFALEGMPNSAGRVATWGGRELAG